MIYRDPTDGGGSPSAHSDEDIVTRFDKRYVKKGWGWTGIVAAGALALAGIFYGINSNSNLNKKTDRTFDMISAQAEKISADSVRLSQYSDSLAFEKAQRDSVDKVHAEEISQLREGLYSIQSGVSALEKNLAANNRGDSSNRQEYLSLHSIDLTSIAKDSARIDGTESKLVNISKEVKYIGDVVSGNLDSIQAGFYNGVVGNYNALRDALHQKLGYKKGWFNEFWRSSGDLPSLAKGNVLTKKELGKLMKTTKELGLSGKIDSLSGEISRGNTNLGDAEKNIKEIAFLIFEHNLNIGIYKRWNEGNEYLISKVDSTWVDSLRVANTKH